MQNLPRYQKGNKITDENEEIAINELASVLFSKGIMMKGCSSFGIENSKSKAVIESGVNNHYIGVQITRLSFKEVSKKEKDLDIYANRKMKFYY